MNNQTAQSPENQTISNWISRNSLVLDLGCGSGELLSLISRKKQAKAQGIEISEQAIHSCVAAGLSVYQEDIDTGLADFANNSFDYVILNQTFQQVKKPDYVLTEALRVGKKVIVGFPNFVYYKARFQIFFRGHVPVTPSLPYQWFDTPNLHFLSIADFKDYCKNKGVYIEQTAFFSKNHPVKWFVNFFAETALFLLSK